MSEPCTHQAVIAICQQQYSKLYFLKYFNACMHDSHEYVKMSITMTKKNPYLIDSGKEETSHSDFSPGRTD